MVSLAVEVLTSFVAFPPTLLYIFCKAVWIQLR